MTLSVTVLGSSAMFATVERACAGYLVDIDGTKIWLDAGAGTWRNLLQHVSYADLAAVILTHRHPDHVTDVFQAEHARLYGGPDRLPSLPLWAPAETIERITAYKPDLVDAFELIEVKGGRSLEFAGATFSFVSMAHPPETVGVRIEKEGRSFAYSSDTGGEADFATLAGGVDVFVCEATFQESDEMWEGHLRATQAARHAQEVGAHKLVLTHLPPGRDHDLSRKEAEHVAGGLDVMLAEDGLRLEVGS